MGDNIHAGHRERVRKRFDAVGFAGWSEHEILEFLLFNVYRQRDTNEIAHMLINKYGTLSNVFVSTQISLTSIDGVGDQAAYFLRTIGATFNYINYTNKSSIRLNEKTLPNFLEGLFINERNECLYIILLDSLKRVIKKERMFEGNFDHINVDAKKIFMEALQNKAEFVVMAHNHPHGTLRPSDADIQMTDFLERSLLLVDSNLLEHYVVCGNKYVGVLDYIRKHGKGY